ncbi:HAD-IC family P-type ATPase [Brochothrix campestris]|uniref:HAD-IC family P-type ATPase n=2 Tax=Brochothrix campestris TaxID=2757 RepID=UPI0038D1515D
MINPSEFPGLSTAEVEERRVRGDVNELLQPTTRSLKQILLENSLTLFNFINLVIGGFIIYTGSFKNLLFLGVILFNTAIGIFQELRAKKNIDQLMLLNQAKVNVIRNAQSQEIAQDEVVKNDLIAIKRGQQICVDGIVTYTRGFECDESQLTGEADPIIKTVGDIVYSGSYVVSGTALIEATHVGQESYVAKLTLAAKQSKSIYSELIRTMKQIIRVLSFGIIPIGALLFMTSIFTKTELNQAILGTSAAVLGMIPEGLILLTSVALALGVVRLTRKRVLVKTMGSIETLARVDILCLDKTGTLTSGELQVKTIKPGDDISLDTLKATVGQVAHDLNEDNATGLALMSHFKATADWGEPQQIIAFSSARKWSAVSYQGASFVIGAPEYIFNSFTSEQSQAMTAATHQGLRVLAVAKSSETLVGHQLPTQLQLLGLLYLEDDIRAEAPQTLAYFKAEKVDICIISGDHPQTVSQIAKRAGVDNVSETVDMSKLPVETDYQQLVEKNRIYGRVSPEQKRLLVEALQANGHTVGMTGDGVNDILALKQADCSIVMANGSDAAKGISNFVLLDSNFDAMVGVVLEGRKVVNNIQRVASLYLTKTIYSIVLALLFIFISSPYPFQPIQLSPISTLTVGIPSFLLALRPNVAPLKGRFLRNVLEPALASGLSVVLYAMIILVVGQQLNWSYAATSTLTVWMTGMVCFMALSYVARPLNYRIILMITALAATFLLLFIFFGKLFALENLFQIKLALLYVPLMVTVYPLFYSLKKVMKRLLKN